MEKNFNSNIKYRYFSISIFNILLFLSLFCIAGEGRSQTIKRTGISIIVPNTNSQYMKVVTSFKRNLKEKRILETVNLINLSVLQTSQIEALDNKKLVMLIGSKSFDFYSKSGAKTPYLTSLITNSAFNFIFAKTRNKNSFIGGVSITQPPKRFVSLAKLVLPNLNKVALVFGPEMIKNNRMVLQGLKKYNLDYNLVNIQLKDNPVKKLRKAYESNQVLIVFPDRKEINNSLSRWVLTLSYQYKIPVISYSKKYADAGALVSLFSTSAQIGRQSAELSVAFLKNNKNQSKKLLDPKYYDIHINESVSKALNLKIPSKIEILKRMRN